MKILDGLITVNSIGEYSGKKFLVEFSIDSSHKVMAGHFPGHPILPGVVMTDIVQRSLEAKENCNIQMVNASSIKFLKLLEPGKEAFLMEIETDEIDHIYKVSARIIQGETIYFKQLARYRKI